MTTADRIRKAADQYATYTDAAAAADMCLQQLSDYMAGRNEPSLRTIRRLAAAWGVPVEALVGD